MSDIFRPLFRSVEDKVANRREQLRKAQKTFRERRDQYLRTLEKTVKRLQTNEVQFQQQVDRLEHELAATQKRLAEREVELYRIQHSPNGTAEIGPACGTFAFPTEGTADNPYLSPSSDAARNGADSRFSSTTTLVWIETKKDQPIQMHVQQKHELQTQSRWNVDAASNHSSPITPGVASSVTMYVSQLDHVIVAMEFILKLESPCLPHIRQATENDESTTASESQKNSPHGHIHTTSSALLCCAPYPSPLSSLGSPAISSPTSSTNTVSWPAQRATLERLLDISQDLPLDQAWELTPVQAWYCIAQTANFNRVQVQTLNQASDKLLNHVKCYGFGAVIRRDFLTRILADLFA